MNDMSSINTRKLQTIASKHKKKKIEIKNLVILSAFKIFLLSGKTHNSYFLLLLFSTQFSIVP
jgi:hypothetical protein